MANVTAFEFEEGFEATFMVTRNYPFEFNAGAPASPAVVLTPGAPASVIANQPIQIDVTVPLPDIITRLIVTVTYDELQTDEVAFKGLSFAPAFSGKSTLTPLSTGFRISLLRNTNWPASPRVSVAASTDRGGVNA